MRRSTSLGRAGPIGRFLLVAAIVALAVPAPAAHAADTTVTFTGRGWGHGRGMGQYGAYGYARDRGWTAEQILTHFYGGTRLAKDAGNPTMTVELTAATVTPTSATRAVVITAPSLVWNGQRVAAVRVQPNGSVLSWSTSATAGCAGPWTPSSVTTAQTIASPSATDTAQMLRVCTVTGSAVSAPVTYRGSLTVSMHGTTMYTVNTLDTQSYLQSVVPSEMPASWTAAAVQAQAVAARSYALGGAARTSGALTCDSTACQVYSGVRTEYAASNTAVSQTNGWVMRFASGTNAGRVARTEFSSSSGGFTAGGTFPAVVDDGDAIASNPNHVWTTSLPAATVASRLGVGAIGSITVTGRNGYGADGGRATQVTVVSGGTSRTFTGDQVRSALGLKSDWFTIGSTAAAPTPAPMPAPTANRVEYRAHVQNIGWQDWQREGATAGTSGRSLRVEALQLRLPAGSPAGGIECAAHVQNIGWTGWVATGQTCGTSGRSLRVEALRLRLTGTIATQFDIWYRVHVQDIGWMGWASNGADAGSAGMALRTEAVEVRLVPKGQGAPASAGLAFVPVTLTVAPHVATLGWMAPVGAYQTAGTSGRALRLEALRVSAATPWSGGLECRAHVQDVGWTGWVAPGAVCGTTGRGLRQEALALRLTGAAASSLDVWYRVHVQDVGWMGWARNGANAGTAGYSRRVEAVQVAVTPRGAPAPGSTARAFLVR